MSKTVHVANFAALLLFTLSMVSVVHASEITGTLSSGVSADSSTTGGTLGGSVSGGSSDGSISGTATGGRSGGSGGGGGSEGSVLGAFTGPNDPGTSPSFPNAGFDPSQLLFPFKIIVSVGALLSIALLYMTEDQRVPRGML